MLFFPCENVKHVTAIQETGESISLQPKNKKLTKIQIKMLYISIENIANAKYINLVYTLFSITVAW